MSDIKLSDVPEMEWHEFKKRSPNVRKYLIQVISDKQKAEERGKVYIGTLKLIEKEGLGYTKFLVKQAFTKAKEIT